MSGHVTYSTHCVADSIQCATDSIQCALHDTHCAAYSCNVHHTAFNVEYTAFNVEQSAVSSYVWLAHKQFLWCMSGLCLRQSSKKGETIRHVSKNRKRTKGYYKKTNKQGSRDTNSNNEMVECHDRHATLEKSHALQWDIKGVALHQK